MRVYKIEIMVIDYDQIGYDGIKPIIESVHHHQDHIEPKVMGAKFVEIGELKNNIELITKSTSVAAFHKLFYK